MAHLPILLAALFLADAAAAKEPVPDPARAVNLFNIFCLSQLPDLDGVGKAAGFGEFAQIAGPELDSYRPAPGVEDFRAWRFHDHGEAFVLTAARAKADIATVKALPHLAKATKASCSLRFPAPARDDAVIDALGKLLNRTPDETLKKATADTRIWKGKDAKRPSRVDYATQKDAGVATLTASVFVLN